MAESSGQKSAVRGQMVVDEKKLVKLKTRGGSALIVVMWVLLILALLVSSMVYDMHIEATLTAYQRNRTQAQQPEQQPPQQQDAATKEP